jgi:hypothetical protein
MRAGVVTRGCGDVRGGDTHKLVLQETAVNVQVCLQRASYLSVLF